MHSSPIRRRVAAMSLAAVFGFGLQSAVAAEVAKVDSDFVGKVSQGGSFEVMASKLAVERAQSSDVKAFAEKDVADHEKVNDELKGIASAQELPLAPTLNATLQKKLDRLGKLTGPSFDKAYVREMATIHHKDEGIFAHEAKVASNDDWKAFAGKTDAIVKGHIEALTKVEPTLR